MNTSTHSVENKKAVRPRIAFLGVGWIGRNRLDAMAGGGGIDVIGVADQIGELADSVSAELVCDACRSLDELLELKPDGVVIATPSALHANQTIAALEAGAAVFCQKPLARTADETRLVVEAARSAGRLLGVDLSYRHVTGMQRIRELIAAGEIGRVFAVDLVFHNAYGPDKSWYYDIDRSGGGCVIDLGIHLVDLALWTLGYPQPIGITSRLFAEGTPLNGRRDKVEDYAVARIDLDDAVSLNLACSWRLAAGRDAVIEATFHGTRGGLRLHNLNGSFYDLAAERFFGTRREVIDELDRDWGGRAAAAWARRLATSNRFDPAIERIVDVASVLDMIYGR